MSDSHSISPPGPELFHGILLVDKPTELVSFRAITLLRRLTGERTIGHAGTLDPFASGLLILLIGKPFTRQSDTFLNDDKEYLAKLRLGAATDSYDRDGSITATSSLIPTLEEVLAALNFFQGDSLQVPPMFSAKKLHGQKLYHLARQGVTVERTAVPVSLTIEFLSYEYPELNIRVSCSKGTYIRSLAHDIGQRLMCYAHLGELRRIRSGPFSIHNAIAYSQLVTDNLPAIQKQLVQTLPLRTPCPSPSH